MHLVYSKRSLTHSMNIGVTVHARNTGVTVFCSGISCRPVYPMVSWRIRQSGETSYSVYETKKCSSRWWDNRVHNHTSSTPTSWQPCGRTTSSINQSWRWCSSRRAWSRSRECNSSSLTTSLRAMRPMGRCRSTRNVSTSVTSRKRLRTRRPSRRDQRGRRNNLSDSPRWWSLSPYLQEHDTNKCRVRLRKL
jgi:hypothetical protein